GLALPGSLGAYLQHLHQSLVHGLAGLGSGSMNESVSEGLSHGTWKLPLPRKKRGKEARCFFPSSGSRDGWSGSSRSGTGRAGTGLRLAANAGEGRPLGLLLGGGLELEPSRIVLAFDLDDDYVLAA